MFVVAKELSLDNCIEAYKVLCLSTDFIRCNSDAMRTTAREPVTRT